MVPAVRKKIPIRIKTTANTNNMKDIYKTPFLKKYFEKITTPMKLMIAYTKEISTNISILRYIKPMRRRMINVLVPTAPTPIILSMTVGPKTPL
jgi:hypothetical protein